MLLDAIFAFSARDLSRRNETSLSYPHDWAEVADEYHSSCVHRLIPALEEPSLTTESALTLSTVILRMHEMLGSHVNDAQSHLRGCVLLFQHNRNSFRRGSMQHAAFWTYIRQEILTALANGNGCPTNVDTSDQTYRVVFSGETDDEWTDNITWLTASVINYCFAGRHELDSVLGLERWKALRRDIDNWRECLPDTFRPISVLADEQPFPIITYLGTWHSKKQFILQNPWKDPLKFADNNVVSDRHAILPSLQSSTSTPLSNARNRH